VDRATDFAIVVLAGGEGRRIGGEKPLRLLGGRRLIDRALEFAGALTPHLAVSVHSRDQIGEIAVPTLLDARDGGPIAGLDAALSFAAERGLERLLTLPCDAPFLPPDLANRLNGALGPTHAAAIPTSGGRLHPTAALWRASARKALEAYRASGGSSLTGFAKFTGFVEVSWDAAELDPFFNINSAGDLAAAETMLQIGSA
jgi:molybdopterin-guanine dinucleotide biosynthesis protein A